MDTDSIMKSLRSLWLSFWPALIIFILGWVNNFSFSNPEMTSVVAWTTSNLVYVVYKARDGKITILNMGWSFVLSTIMALAVYVKSLTGWCNVGEYCALIYSGIALIVPTIVNTIKEYIRETSE